jgi:DNA-binding transcriptional regulator YbjK
MMQRADAGDESGLSKPQEAAGAPAPPAKPRRTRKPRQERARKTCALIAQAAIGVLAKQGLARVTHRSVATEAGVALAATTYYYATKSDIIGAASSAILQHYVDTFERTAEKYRRNPSDAPPFREFVWRQLRKVARQDRMMMMAWQEISLDAVRGNDSLVLMRKWHGEIDSLWTRIARVTKTPNPKHTARSGVDLVLGLLLMVCALSLTPDEIDAVLVGNGEPSHHWARRPDGAGQTEARHRSPKADGTRARLLDAAIEILIAEGPAAIGYRAIAERAGLTVTAPAYYFPTTAGIIEAAQRKLFADSKMRYSAMMHTLHPAESHIADLTATIFIREATEFAQVNLANRAIWIEAGRRPQLAPMVWSAIGDQDMAWRRALTASRGGRPPLPRDGILAQALFLGKLQRVLSTGSDMMVLARIRAEFARDLAAIVDGRFWAQLG